MAVGSSPTPYRSQLYFWHNTVIFKMNQSQAYRANVFDLSLVGTTVDAWDNAFALETVGGEPTFLSWVQLAGVLNLRGTNLGFGLFGPASDMAEAGMYRVNVAGRLLTEDPEFAEDLTPAPGSPLVDAATGLPEGVPADLAARHPVDRQPGPGTNGARSRVRQGAADDLGALEAP